MPEPRVPPSSGWPFPRIPEVVFANWREILRRSGLSPGVRTVSALAVGGYLGYRRQPTTVSGQK